MTALLDLRGVTAFYGPVQALFGVDLSIAEGEVVALMGRNGMGKTTTIRTICGCCRHGRRDPASPGGTWRGFPSHRAAQAGLGLVPEGRRCFAPLTVAENLIAAARPGRLDTGARCCDLFPRLGERMGQTRADAVGRRAADAGHRPGADDQSAPSHPRRGDGGARARSCGRRSGRRSGR